MALSDKMGPASEAALERVLNKYYSPRHADVLEAKQIIDEEIGAGKIKADMDPFDILNLVFFGLRDDAYFVVRGLALEILRNPERVNTTSTSEGLAAALLFDRKEWLGNDTWAYAAKRVGHDWLEAIVQLETDLRWMKLLPLEELKIDLGKLNKPR